MYGWGRLWNGHSSPLWDQWCLHTFNSSERPSYIVSETYGQARKWCEIARLLRSDLSTFSPFWACPIRRRAIAAPFFVKKPLLSSSAMLHISPRTVGGSLEPPNILTATSPVRMPILCESVWANIWLTKASSACVGVKLVAIERNGEVCSKFDEGRSE